MNNIPNNLSTVAEEPREQQGLVPTILSAVPSTRTAAVEGRRRKLWEVEPRFHCSLVGTCLSVEELRTLARKAKNRRQWTTDYEVHLSFVRQAEKKTRTTELMQRRLERKYARTVAQFSRAKTDEELYGMWLEAVAAGKLAGAYWAIVTHHGATGELRNRLFGEVHMYSHLAGQTTGQSQRRVERLSKELAEARARSTEVEGQLREERAARRAADRRAEELGQEAGQLRATAESLTRRVGELENGDDLLDLNGQVSNLSQRVTELTAELERGKASLEKLHDEEVRLRSQNEALQQDHIVLTQEIALLEGLVAADLTEEDRDGEGGDCETCPVRNDCAVRLGGTRVLYLGGRRHLVRHYRELVQSHGAQFLHHQGGLEGGKRLLPEVVARADVVLCPLDCISHEATQVAKGVCKRSTKPFIPLRSSGLSSLEAGLQALAAAAPA